MPMLTNSLSVYNPRLWPVASAGPALKLAVLGVFGQSNNEGRAAREAQDIDVPGIFQFPGWPLDPDYGAFRDDITPLVHRTNFTNENNDDPPIPFSPTLLGPAEYTARVILANGFDKVAIVPCAQGSTAMVTGVDPQWAPGNPGGALFENAISQMNLAIALATATYPSHEIVPIFSYVIGEQDSANGATKAAFKTGLSSTAVQLRSRVTGAANAEFIFGSMVPERWLEGDPAYSAGYALVNQATVEFSVENAGIKYSMGPHPLPDNENLHFQGADKIRDQGNGMGNALFAETLPTITIADTASNTVGDQLSIALTGSLPHQTFEIVGGTYQSEVELSDYYLNPVIRWTSNGTGPAIGSGTIILRARTGGGFYGDEFTLTLSVIEAGTGDVASVFKPGNIGDYYDFMDPANLRASNAGTGAVSEDDAFGQVIDLSGLNRPSSSHADNGNRPTYALDGDSDGCALFSGSQALFGQPFAVGGDDLVNGEMAYTVIALVQRTGGASGSKVVTSMAAADGGSNIFDVMGSDSSTPTSNRTVYRDDSSAGLASIAKTPNAFDGNIQVLTVRSAGMLGRTEARREQDRPVGGGNGGYTGQNYGFGGLDFNFARSAIGVRGSFNGANPNYGNGFTGRVYAILRISRDLTDAEVKFVADAFAAKKGIILP